MPCEINNNRCIQLGRKSREPFLAHSRVAYFGSGREALISLAQALSLGPDCCVLLPAYMPEGVFRPFDVYRCRIVRYPVDENLDPIWDVLEDLLAQERPALAVLIHYFGLEKDAARFGRLCRRCGTAMLEDMAHILPGPNCSAGRDGDYVLYSPTKVVGVPDGGILVCRSANANLREVHFRFSTRRIFYLCQQISLLIIATLARRIPAGPWLSWLLRLTAPLLDSYSTLMSYFQSPHKTSWVSRWLLRRCDWAGWAAQRRTHADSYAAGLDPRVFRRLHGKFPVGGGPFAFPVLVSDREDLQRFLGEHRITGLILAARWDFIPNEERVQHPAAVLVLKKHFLFPTVQSLSEAEVATVIALANKWAAERIDAATT
jgi:hypothetical protein